MKSIHKKHTFITVIVMDDDTGKLYKSDWDDSSHDPQSPKISKQTSFMSGAGYGLTYRCTNTAQLAQIIKDVSIDTRKAVVLGYIKGTEPKDDADVHGEQYRLLPAKKFAEKFQDHKPPFKTPLRDNISKELYATRTAGMFSRCTWFAFDLDMSPHMPDKLQNEINSRDYIDLLGDLCPQLKDVDYLAVQSSSSRVMFDGERLAKSNSHIYMQCDYPSDLSRFSSSLLVKSINTEYGYLHPVVDVATGKIKEDAKGVPATIFDKSVFSKARVMFEGSPKVLPHDPMVNCGRLSVSATDIKQFKGSKATVDTMGYSSPTPDEEKQTRLSLGRTARGFTLMNTTDLTADVSIEVKDIENHAEKVITMQEFVDGDVPRYRAQNPFKPESTSWSAFLSKEDDEGEPIHPYLHSNEMGNFYYADNQVSFADFVNDELGTTGTLLPPPPPPVEVPTLNVSQSDNIYKLPQHVIDKNNNRLNLNTGKNLHVYPLPDELDDVSLGKEFHTRYFGETSNGISDFIPATGNLENEYHWCGTHWEKINAGAIRSLITKCATEGFVKKLTSSRVSSIYKLMTDNAMAHAELKPLPSHIIPLANGAYDFSTGLLMQHEDVKQYFYTHSKEFEYNPNEKGEGLLERIIDQASMGDPEFVRQCKQMAGYCIAGGYNIAHKIFYLDGVPRSGKSLVAQTITRITQHYLSIEIGQIADLKILNNIPDRSLLYDDDAQPPMYNQIKAITGTLKKLVSGDNFAIQQMYTKELQETRLHPKILIACNGLPMLNDPSGAIHDRGLILPFKKSFKGKEDFSLQTRIATPVEMSASFNLFIEGYLDLLQYNGYNSIAEFNESKEKRLNFVQCEASKQAERESLGESQPLTMFLTEQCDIDENIHVSVTDMEFRIRQWLEKQRGLDSLSRMSSVKLRKNIRNACERFGYEYGVNRRTPQGKVTSCIIGVRPKFGDING